MRQGGAIHKLYQFRGAIVHDRRGKNDVASYKSRGVICGRKSVREERVSLEARHEEDRSCVSTFSFDFD